MDNSIRLFFLFFSRIGRSFEQIIQDVNLDKPKIYVLFMLVFDGFMFDVFGVLTGIEIGDGKLHKLKQNILNCFFALKLMEDLAPTFSLAISHEIQ